MEISERISSILSHYNLSVNEFVARTGIKTKQAVYDMLHGKTRSISSAMENKILSCFPEINRAWLLTGDGEMMNTPPPPMQPPDDDTIIIPVVNLDSRGGMAFNEEVQTDTYITGKLPFRASSKASLHIAL